MRESAQDIAEWIREVKEETAADKVDLVGYSEGGVMALYVPMTQPGIADVVERVVAIGPAVHGAQYYGLTDLAYAGGEATRKMAQDVLDGLGCAACDDMATGGAVYRDFMAAPKIVQDGNKATIIVSTNDKLVAPETSRVDEPGVRTLVVQDYCPEDRVGHIGFIWDTGVWALIVNALAEEYDREVRCHKGLEI